MKMSNKGAILCLVLAPLLWSGNFIIGRFLHNTIPPFSLAFYRWLLVIVILLPFVFQSLLSYISQIKKHFLYLLVLSVLSVSIYTSFMYWGLHYTTVITAGCLNTTVPIFIILFSSLILKDQITTTKVVAILFSLFGSIIVLSHGRPDKLLAGMLINRGDLIICAAVVSWALFSVMYKKLPVNMPPLLFLFVTACLGEFFILPVYLYEMIYVKQVVLHLHVGLCVGYASVFSSILAITFWNIGVRKIGPSNASYFFNLLPIFSSILAIVFLKEHLHLYQIVGGTFVVLSIVLINKKPANRNSNFNNKDYVKA